ncbi:MAG: putative DNA repair helicase RadD [Chlamydiae bacterium]|nr:putative DNA repair helicase RadD [Chlamydiota bacterium]
MLTPREYQLEALEAINDCWANGITRQLVSLPTGVGKTIIFALLAKLLNTKTLIVAHTEELINQAYDKLKVVWPEADVGIVKAGTNEIYSQVVIASIQTASRMKRLGKLKQQSFDLLIIDEAHHAAAASYERLVRELGFFDEDPSKLLVGVTATPKRGDGVGLGSIFQEIVFERSISTMIRGGYLAPLLGKQVHTKIDLRGIGVRAGDFITSELARAVNTSGRNQLIIENYKAFAEDRKKTLAFCVDVQHAKDLADAFNECDISAKAVYGDMDKEERAQSLQDFKDGKYQMLTNCLLLTEGFDERAVDCVIMSRPTKSASLFTQMIGRGTRTFPTKKNCLILDFCDNSTRNDLCTYKNTLDGAITPLFPSECDIDVLEGKESPIQQIDDCRNQSELQVIKDRIEDIEFFETAHFAWIPVGDSWHLSLGLNRDIWVRQVKGGFLVTAQSDGDITQLSNRPLPLDYALGVAEDWSRKQTTKSTWARKDAPWRSLPASQKQLDSLSKMGIQFSHGITKGDAAQLLDKKLNDPATDKQRYFLKRRGVKITHNLTKIGACKLISNLK